MGLGHQERPKDYFYNSMKQWMFFLLCLLSASLLSFSSDASTSNPEKVVRVGFFDFGGYHETDDKNQHSGYGYEYIHEMAKYTGWVFEYVNGTWSECQEMLKNGDIDLLTSAQYSEERDEYFDFSEASMGTSYAQLTVMDHNTIYGRNDYDAFNGIKIGLLKGNSRNDRLAEFAKEKGFIYSSILYETQSELDAALKTGTVDAVLTSSLRKLKNESIIAQFAPSPFYAIVKKGNDKLLSEVNFALESIEMNSPAFRYNLYQEYYRGNTTDTFVLSREEKEYLETKPTVRAVICPGAAPVSYWKDGEFQGISADVLKYLLGDLNIQVEYICPKSLKDGYQMLADGSADIACLFESDYNLAEQYHTRITSTYLTNNYSIISQKQPNQNLQAIQSIAIPNGGMVGMQYARSYYPDTETILVSTNDAAIEAVSQGDADLALVNVYSAEKGLMDYPNLRAAFVGDVEQQYSVGVSQAADVSLYSILDKKINTLSNQVLDDILYQHTMSVSHEPSLMEYFKQNPVKTILLSTGIFLSIIGVLLYAMIMNKRHAKIIYKLAYIDKLTKLWNNNGFLLQSNLLLEKNPTLSFAVAAIDLSKFSTVNENHGRSTGDKVIQFIGNKLNRFSNEQTVVAHFDADHFLMLLSYKNEEDIYSTLTAIAGELGICDVDGLILRFDIYIGVGFIDRREGALLHAIDHASIARNKCTANQPIVYMNKVLQDSLIWEKEIYDHVDSALEDGEFKVYYQPKVNMPDKKIIGAEALIRWEHGKLGFLNPADFIPILEQSGMVTEVDFFVLEEACKLERKWIDAGQTPVIISVNQSRVHFLKSNYIERLQGIISKYNIPSGLIELEITETLFGQENITDELIKKMKAIGLLISIDDFGSGYSSLYLLHQISVDILKIDKGLLDEGGKHIKMRNIIRRVVQIAADLGVDVICEGVETEEQVKFLLEIDCKYAQGFLFSKPLPQPEFELLMKQRK